MELHVFPEDIKLHLFGKVILVRETYLSALLLIALIILFALFIRIFIIRRFTTNTRKVGKAQMICEYLIKMLDGFTEGIAGHLGHKLSPYILALAFYILFSGVIELFGIRTPLSDLSTAVSFGLSTFVLINYYGLKEKGPWGRIKSYFKPNPIIAPFKLISDMAVPVSLSCRLFGNLMGGYIVMELLYELMQAITEKYYLFVIPEVIAGALPGILALYFTLFHVLIQFYIFSTLSLTFIREAAED